MSNKFIKLQSESCISGLDDHYEYVENGIIEVLDTLQQEYSEVDSEEDIKNICDLNRSQTSVTMTNKALNHFYELNIRKEE